MTTADNLVVRIESDGGIVGWGESASAPIMTGETVESMVAAVRHLAPYVAGRAADDFAGASSVMNLWMYEPGGKRRDRNGDHDLVGPPRVNPCMRCSAASAASGSRRYG